MTEKLREKLLEFNKTNSNNIFFSDKYKRFEKYINECISGEGMIGENSYLILWEKSDIEELNDDYEVNEFLTNSVLIGSDGGDTAYGINEEGKFFSVPFIGMDNDEVEVMGNNFEEFIEKLYGL